jgi:hypothetical protein
MDSISQRFGNLSPLKQALLALEDMQARLAESERLRTEPSQLLAWVVVFRVGLIRPLSGT